MGGTMANPITTLTTARLLGEAITPSHFPDIHRLHSDPQVMKTLSAGGKPPSMGVKPRIPWSAEMFGDPQ
jgi:hypothetical protein